MPFSSAMMATAGVLDLLRAVAVEPAAAVPHDVHGPAHWPAQRAAQQGAVDDPWVRL